MMTARSDVTGPSHLDRYNGDGQRLRTQRDVGTDSRFVWDGQNILVETNDAGTSTRAVYTLVLRQP